MGIGLVYWFFVCIGIALLYWRYWPRPKGRSKFVFMMLRYGHTAVWLFIAIAVLNHQYGQSRILSELFGYVAFGLYGLFIGTLLHDRWRHR